MKTLYLLRHSKSDWDSVDKKDHDRPLNSRGQKNARELGKFLRDSHVLVHTVLSSSSVRTKETLLLLQEEWYQTKEIREVPELYEATPSILWGLVHSLSDDISSALFLGHNPGLEKFANECLVALNASLFVKFPTSALLCLETQKESWADLQKGDFQLKYLRIPLSSKPFAKKEKWET